MLSRKAQGEILTSLFTVIVILAASIAFIGFQELLFITDANLKTRLMKYEVADDVKSYLIKEKGYPIPFNISSKTTIPITDDPISLEGLVLEQLDFPFCEPEMLINYTADTYDDTVVTIMPIAHNHTTCPGRLTVFI